MTINQTAHLQVNLLDDHLVDVLLDSAASGWNTVEREGISISHPARFILVGSGEWMGPSLGRGALAPGVRVGMALSVAPSIEQATEQHT